MARDSKRNKKGRKAEKEVGRQHKGLDWTRICQLKIEKGGDALLRPDL